MARGWPVLLLVALAACGGNAAEDDPSTGASSRPAGFRSCPATDLVPLPAGFRLVRRDLSSLGQGRMGKLEIYRHGLQQIQVFSGPDVYDKLDDVDLVPRQVMVDGRRFQVWATAVDRSLLLAQLEDDRLEAPCDNVGVLTRHVDRATFLRLLGDLRVEGIPGS